MKAFIRNLSIHPAAFLLLVSLGLYGCKDSNQDTTVKHFPHIAASPKVSFTDTDPDSGQIGGNVILTPSKDESEFVNYQVFFGTTPVGYLSGSDTIAQVTPTGTTITYTIPQNTTIPTGAAYLLATGMTKDSYSPPYSHIILFDLGAP